MAKIKPTHTNNLAVKRPGIAKYYSDKNQKTVEEVLPTETNEYLFLCSNPNCGAEFFRSPSRMKNAYSLVYCNEAACQDRQKEEISYLKMQQKVRESGSLATQKPKIAQTWLKTVEEFAFPYTVETVSTQSTIMVWWQCNDVDYHVWDQRVDRRVNHPNCPYCAGQRVHIKDSYYTKLVEKGWLKYLDEDEHEKAKTIVFGKNNLKLLHTCRNCGEPSLQHPRTFFKVVTGCQYCQNTMAVESRMANAVTEHGSIADDPLLLAQYCYDQVDIPRDKCNETPPSEVPLNYGNSVHWRCERGHYTKSPVNLRTKGVICGKCSSQSSFLEVALYKELEGILGKDTVEFRGKINGKESDLILWLIPIPIALEVDGHHYHKGEDKAKTDSEKGAVFKEQKFTVVRIREEPLQPIPNTDLTISFTKRGSSQREVMSGKHNVVLAIINKLLRYIDRDEIEELNCLGQANETYNETRKVSYSESVAATHPHLLNEVDTSKCTLDLSKLSAGSDTLINWKCSVCGYSWPATISKRTHPEKPTGCPGCAGQVVTPSNCIAAVAPFIVEALYDPEDAYKYTAGSGARLNFKCTFEGCNAESNPRAVKDAVKQFERKGHNYFHNCKH
ncbi:zinc-ribbon domain-containing protein [Vibrio splendidus]